MLTEIKDPEKLKKIAAEAVIKYADQIEINRKLQSRLAAAEAECAIYYEIAAAAIGEEQTIALRDAAMRRRRCRDGKQVRSRTR